LYAGFGMYQAYINENLRPTERQEYQSLDLLPAFYLKFFDNLLQVGCGFGFGMELGPGKTYKDAPYQYFSVEPQIRLNIGPHAFVAAVYNYTEKYAWFNDIDKDRRGEKSVKHAINIRAVYTF